MDFLLICLSNPTLSSLLGIHLFFCSPMPLSEHDHLRLTQNLTFFRLLWSACLPLFCLCHSLTSQQGPHFYWRLIVRTTVCCDLSNSREHSQELSWPHGRGSWHLEFSVLWPPFSLSHPRRAAFWMPVSVFPASDHFLLLLPAHLLMDSDCTPPLLHRSFLVLTPPTFHYPPPRLPPCLVKLHEFKYAVSWWMPSNCLPALPFRIPTLSPSIFCRHTNSQTSDSRQLIFCFSFWILTLKSQINIKCFPTILPTSPIDLPSHCTRSLFHSFSVLKTPTPLLSSSLLMINS